MAPGQATAKSISLVHVCVCPPCLSGALPAEIPSYAAVSAIRFPCASLFGLSLRHFYSTLVELLPVMDPQGGCGTLASAWDGASSTLSCATLSPAPPTTSLSLALLAVLATTLLFDSHSLVQFSGASVLSLSLRHLHQTLVELSLLLVVLVCWAAVVAFVHCVACLAYPSVYFNPRLWRPSGPTAFPTATRCHVGSRVSTPAISVSLLVS